MSINNTIITPSSHVSGKPVAPGQKLAILHKNGTYFGGWSGIGPRFGVGVGDAHLFDDGEAASEMLGRHFAFAEAKIVMVKVEDSGDRSLV